MGNMSYCRFENTKDALEDCLSAVEEMDSGEKQFSDLSDIEREALRAMIDICESFHDTATDLLEDEE